MNITLTKQQETFIRDNLNSGMFPSESAAVSAGLKLLQKYEQNLHQNIAASLEEVKAGKSRPFNGQVVNELKAALQQRLDNT